MCLNWNRQCFFTILQKSSYFLLSAQKGQYLSGSCKKNIIIIRSKLLTPSSFYIKQGTGSNIILFFFKYDLWPFWFASLRWNYRSFMNHFSHLFMHLSVTLTEVIFAPGHCFRPQWSDPLHNAKKITNHNYEWNKINKYKKKRNHICVWRDLF